MSVGFYSQKDTEFTRYNVHHSLYTLVPHSDVTSAFYKKRVQQWFSVIAFKGESVILFTYFWRMCVM